jgi:hypothetical protein
MEDNAIWLTVAGFDDFVAKYGGDGLLLSFGNTMASKGSAGRRLTPDPKVIAYRLRGEGRCGL